MTTRQSRVSSILKALIHVFPIAFALLEITINLRGHYIGDTFDKQSYYQLAAKAHEISIDASLASIVVSYVRYELTIGSGLPFGAFLGSLQFSSVSYLWSRELWSSLFTTGFRVRRIAFFLLVVISGVIAATAGPSSATLLIPRQTFWSVEPSYVLINGTFQDIWPDCLDSIRVPKECSFVDPSSAISNVLCPGSNWLEILNSLADSAGESSIGFLDVGPGTSGFLWEFEATGTALLGGDIASCPSNITSPQTCGIVEPLILGIAAFNDSYLWEAQKGITSYFDVFHSVSDNLYAANIAVQCLHDTIEDVDDIGAIQFPGLFRTQEQYARPTEVISLINLTKSEVYASPSNASEYGLIWMSLPESLFEGIVSGVVLTEPRNSVAGSPMNITTCTIAGGWGSSSLEEDLYQNDLNIFPIDVPTSMKYLLIPDTSSDTLLGPASFYPFFANDSGSMYPQRPFEMSVEWLEYLNPMSTLPNGINSTVINAYMSLVPERLSEHDIAGIIGFMIEVGLSIVGIDLPWQGLIFPECWLDPGYRMLILIALPNGPITCDKCQVFKVNHQYSGWAYISNGVPVKLAVAVMIAYCILALGHIFYLGFTGLSSDAWDSAAEVVALAMNSSPTQHLENTCSGIYGIKVFQTTVRIVATKRESSGTEDHLELVFGDESEAKGPEVRMKMDEEYGSFPPKAHQE